jgi:enoyl-CoA hydratase/carnithine racemase
VSEDRVRIDVADHVATVTLTRADKHNALDRPMFEAIIAAAERLSDEPGVRVVVLHGEGPSFCSGLDLASLISSDAGIEAIVAPLREEPPNWFQRTAYDWLRLPVPVIAAIHGNCFGGGLQIALGADIRIATPDARLSVMEVKWGLIPDMSITRTLPRLVGIDVAKELTFTGRLIDGTEAQRLGLITRVDDDPLGVARELAADIASKSPDAIRGAKRLFNASRTRGRDPEFADRFAQPACSRHRRASEAARTVHRPGVADRHGGPGDPPRLFRVRESVDGEWCRRGDVVRRRVVLVQLDDIATWLDSRWSGRGDVSLRLAERGDRE